MSPHLEKLSNPSGFSSLLVSGLVAVGTVVLLVMG